MSASFIKKKKNNSSLLKCLSLLVFLFVFSFGFSQNKKDLENKKKKLQKDIEYTNQLLNETKKNKKLSLNQLVTLNKKISVREELIGTINNEINLLSGQIQQNNQSITVLQSQLRELKKQYSKMIYHAYKNQDSYTRLMFVFAAQDFTQAYMRLKYFQKYNEFRKKQANKIITTQVSLGMHISQLEETKGTKKVLLVSQEGEKKNLTKEKTEKEQVFSQLQNKEKQLKQDLEKKKRDAEKLQLAIQRLIEAEIKKAKAKAKEDKKPEPKGIVLTPETQALSNSFESNKGKLPWPVLKGIITSKFGVHPHPLMPEINISNNGVDITTSKGTLARAVFDGEVTGVASVPGAGKLIIVRHGAYLSVYSNLNEVYVKEGDKIKTKQNIGTIMFDDSESRTELHLEIWKGQTKLNPESWLFRN